MMLTRSRVAFLAVMAWTASGLRAQQPADLPLAEQLLPGLQPILQSALQQSPKILQRNLDLIQADAAQQSARSRLLPNVSLGLSFNEQWENRDDNNPATPQKYELTKKFYYNLNFSQPIYHWGALKNGLEISKINQQITQKNLHEAYRTLALEVRAAYLQLVLTKMALRNNALFEKRALENVTRQEARQKANQITVGELLGHQMQADEVALMTRRSEGDLDFALRNFRRLTGLTDFSVGDIPDALPAIDANPKSVQPTVDAAYLDNAALQVNSLEIEKTRLDAKIIDRNLYPKFGLTAGANQDEQRYTKTSAPYKVAALYVGVGMSWTIFDGYNNRSQRLQNATRLRQLEASRKELIESSKQNAEQDARFVSLAWSTYRIASLKYRFAREGLTFQEQRLSRGDASTEDVATARANAYAAEYQYSSALIAYLNASATFRSTVHADPIAAR